MDAAWQTVEMALQSEDNVTDSHLKEALAVLIEQEVGAAVEQKLISCLESSVQNDLLPLSHPDSKCTFPLLVSIVFDHVKQFNKGTFRRVLDLYELLTNSNQTSSALQRIYLTTLLYPQHHSISLLAKEFYLSAYLACTTCKQGDAEDEQGDESMCSRCYQETCQCEEIILEMQQIRQQIQELGLFHSLIEETLLVIVRAKIKEEVATKCSGVFDRNVIQDLVQWLNVHLVGWLKKAADKYDTSEVLASEHLLYHLYDSFVRLRLGEMLPMIIDYPDSKAGFEDLHFALPNTNLRSELIASLKQVYESRILHPGVTTTDILTAYIQSIQALRVLDSSCVLLEIVTERVKQYLRSRDDTVRCIVSNLIDDSCEVLADELTKAVSDQDIVDEDNIGNDWDNWQPDPVDANPEISSKTRRSTDIINMLVSIYHSKELFIKEYWNLLADRLLSNLSYTTLWEIRYFELLKIRFGETDLHKCEVMLKDMTDSKRLNNWINDELLKAPVDQQIPFQMNALMLSGQYWPTFRDEKLRLPSEMQSALDKYTKAYETTKVNRTLKWQPHIGQVEIDIEMDSGQVLSFKTAPVNVAIIMAFQEKDTYSVDDLCEKLQTSASVIRKRISYWLTHGVLRENSHDVYALNKDNTMAPIADLIMEEDTESAMASAEDQREEEFQMLWTYVNGMLTNMESQSLERIHSMLKMFANTECSVGELENFLSRKIREGKLVCAAGVYKLAK